VVDKSGRIKDLVYGAYQKSIPIAKPFLKGNEFKYVAECIVSGWISSQGKYVVEFEDKFAEFCETKYSLATSNGTTALHLALAALDIGAGDEVIVPTLTFIATANAVSYTGARAVFVDSEKATYNMDPARIEQAINPRTKAIIPVHLYGQPARMDQIMAIAKKHGLFVVEDAAEAHGAEYRRRKVGSIGDIGCFSFFGNKIITTGEGGMLVTDNRKIYDKAKILRDHGMSRTRKYWHEFIGFNYRLTNVQAAIGCAQMEKIDSILRQKIEIAKLYKQYLAGDDRLILPPENKWSKNVFWMYALIVKEPKNSRSSLRDKVMDSLKKDSIEVRPFFYPIHLMPPYKQRAEFPAAEEISRSGIMLPSYFGIEERGIKLICDSLKKALGSK
jgi:perosamine synthetase